MGAVISDCGKYRYTLEREWMTGTGTCLFVMLNPSTADASEDDPTIRRCVKFAQRWGYQRLTVGNIFNFRSPYPRALLEVDDPLGPEAGYWMRCLLEAADLKVAAWGASPLARERAGDLMAVNSFVCRGTTADGSPKHPLARGKHRVPDDFEPVPFSLTSQRAA
jgi:hypothetical protein